MATKRKIKRHKTINTSLLDRKNPADDAPDLSFSITKHAFLAHDYRAAPGEKTLAERLREWASDFSRPAAERAEKEFNPEEPRDVAVRKVKHQRSPYVVKVGKEAPKGETARENHEDWLKEVERLRREGGDKYKNKTSGAKVNLLPGGKKSVSPAKLVRAVLFWPLELLLSIPLGILLLLQLVLTSIDLASKVAASLARLVGLSTSYVLQEAILILISLIRGAAAVPVKAASLAVLLIFKGAGKILLALGSLANLFFQSLKIFFRTIAAPASLPWKRVIASALFALLLTAPLKILADAPAEIKSVQGQVLGATKEGLAIISAINPGERGQWVEAQAKFNQAQETLSSVNLVLQGLIRITPQGESAVAIIRAGRELSLAGEKITVAAADFKTAASGNALEKIERLSGVFSQTLPNLRAAQENLGRVDARLIPKDEQTRFNKASDFLRYLTGAFEDFVSLSATLAAVLGGDGPRRYAVLFQNDNELRPAGGFIGSLALLTVDQGKISAIEIPAGGSYDFQGQLTEHVLSPRPLQLINPRWQLQDANWFPDWKTSAAKAAWFLEAAGYPSVDGVIGLQASALPKLLNVLGPIEFPEPGATITSANALAEIQKAVELEYDKTKNNPKEYIAQLAPRVLARILAADTGDWLKILEIVNEEVEQKNILFYFSREEYNQQFAARRWQPEILQTKGDYLSIIHANIGGGKTDGVIEETWRDNVSIAENGEATVELVIKRSHRGDPQDYFAGVNNVDYVRVYAPLGSVLVSAEGFKQPAAELFEKAEDYYQPDQTLAAIEGRVVIDEATGTRINQEYGKTVFGNWLQTAAGQTTEVKIKYKLPFRIKPFDLVNPEHKTGYALIMQKQAGARERDFSVTITYPRQWQIAWKKTAGEGYLNASAAGEAIFQGRLNKDAGFALAFVKDKGND